MPLIFPSTLTPSLTTVLLNFWALHVVDTLNWLIISHYIFFYSKKNLEKHKSKFSIFPCCSGFEYAVKFRNKCTQKNCISWNWITQWDSGSFMDSVSIAGAPGVSKRLHDHDGEGSNSSETRFCLVIVGGGCSVTQLCLTLQPHGLQHFRLPWPSLSPRAWSNSCSLSWLWGPDICCPLFLLPSIFPSIRVFFSELAFHIRWPIKYWIFSIHPSNEYSGWISFRIDWFDLLAV